MVVRRNSFIAVVFNVPNYLFTKLFLQSVILSYCPPALLLCVNYVTVCSFCCSWVELSSKINHLTLTFQIFSNKYVITSFLFYDYNSSSPRPLSLEFSQTSSIWEREIERYYNIKGQCVCALCKAQKLAVCSSAFHQTHTCCLFSTPSKLRPLGTSEATDLLQNFWQCLVFSLNCQDYWRKSVVVFLILLIQAEMRSECHWTTWTHTWVTWIRVCLHAEQMRKDKAGEE